MKFICIEGADGAGKSTQSELLYDKLSGLGYNVHLQHFPRYETPIGKLIKDRLYGRVEIGSKAFHSLFELDRIEFTREVEKNFMDIDFIIADRYFLSNLVYCTAQYMDSNSLDLLEDMRKHELPPDLTIIINTEESLAKTEGGDEFDKNKVLQARTRAIYREEAKHSFRTVLVNGDHKKEVVHDLIMKELENRGMFNAT